jgi:hypothetical protein
VYNENPFTFGALALGDAFVDREAELASLGSDLRSGQDVVVLAPRRYGKSSLVLRAMQKATRAGVLVATATSCAHPPGSASRRLSPRRSSTASPRPPGSWPSGRGRCSAACASVP